MVIAEQKKNATDFHRMIKNFFKERNISSNEIVKIIKSEFALYNAMDLKKLGIRQSENKNISVELDNDLNAFWNSLINQSTEFIKNHPELKDILVKRQEDISSEWNVKNMTPDIRINFGIDGLDSSLESLNSDTYLTFGVGNEIVIEKI